MATTTLRVTHLKTDTLTSRLGRGERTMKKIYAMVTGLALGLGVLMGSASAGILDGPTFIPFNYWPSCRAYQTIRNPGILPYAVYQYQLSSRTAPYWVAQALNPWGAAPYFSGISPYGYSVCQGVIGV